MNEEWRQFFGGWPLEVWRALARLKHGAHYDWTKKGAIVLAGAQLGS